MFTLEQLKEYVFPGIDKRRTADNNQQSLPIYVGPKALWQAYHHDQLEKPYVHIDYTRADIRHSPLKSTNVPLPNVDKLADLNN